MEVIRNYLNDMGASNSRWGYGPVPGASFRVRSYSDYEYSRMKRWLFNRELKALNDLEAHFWMEKEKEKK